MMAASIALSQTDSADEVAGNTARSTIPLCDNNHSPSVNGAVALASIGMPTVAERTAATTQWLRSAGATESNDASPHSGACATPAPGHFAVEKPDAPTVGVHQAVFLPTRSIRLHPQPIRRVQHQRGDRDVSPEPAEVTAHQTGSPGSLTSHANRTPEKI